MTSAFIRAVVLAAVIGIACLLPLFLNSGVVFLAAVTYLYVVFAISWNLMFAYTGMASFGHGAFFAIGGYVLAVVAASIPSFPFIPLILVAGLVGLAIALAVGMVILRRSHGVYFAVTTIALSQVVYLLITGSDRLGKDDGFAGVVRPRISLLVADIDLARGQNYYYFVLVASVLLILAMWWLAHSSLGRAWKAIQQDKQRAEFFGINIFRYRLASFAIAAAVASIAGAIYAPLIQIITPDLAYFVFSAKPVLFTMLGGMGSFWGPAIGGVVFGILEYATRTMIGVSEFVIGAVLLLVILVMPTGLYGALQAARKRRDHDVAPASKVNGVASK